MATAPVPTAYTALDQELSAALAHPWVRAPSREGYSVAAHCRIGEGITGLYTLDVIANIQGPHWHWSIWRGLHEPIRDGRADTAAAAIHAAEHATATHRAAHPNTVPEHIIGQLEPNPRAIEVRPCIDTRELHAGDTLYANGFRHGGSNRIVHEVRILPPTAYIRVREGWYRYRRVYAHIHTR